MSQEQGNHQDSAEQKNTSGNDGPPAKNTRKNSGRAIIGEGEETKMVETKTNSKSQKTKRTPRQPVGNKTPKAKTSLSKWLSQTSLPSNYSTAKSATGMDSEITSSKSMYEHEYDQSFNEELQWADQTVGQRIPREVHDINGWAQQQLEYTQTTRKTHITDELCIVGDTSEEEEGDVEEPIFAEDDQEPEQDVSTQLGTEEEEENEQEQEVSSKKVVEMFDILHKSLIDIKKDFADERKENKDKFRKIQRFQNDQKRRIDSASSQVTKCQERLGLLTKIIMKQDQQIRELTTANNSRQKVQSRPNVLVHGIQEEKEEKITEKVTKFFKETMGIQEEILVEDVFRKGKPGTKRPVLIKLKDPKQKGVIFKNSVKLGTINKDNGENFYVNDDLPEPFNEEIRKYRMKIAENYKLIEAQQQHLKIKKGKLLVDGNEYKPLVYVPDNSRMLQKGGTHIQQMLRETLKEGVSTEKDGTRFTGFAGTVSSTQQVQAMYQQMKYRFPQAAHIICVFRIAHEDVAHMQDYCDDGEHGAGRRVQIMMREQSYMNAAVFIVRLRDGPNIGPARFDMIKAAASSALDMLKISNTIGTRISAQAQTPQFSIFQAPTGNGSIRPPYAAAIANKALSGVRAGPVAIRQPPPAKGGINGPCASNLWPAT